MTYETIGTTSLDYFPCRYGASKLLFRGPRRRLGGDYVAFLGGIETYGKFVELPFPTLTEHETGLRSVNLGCANVGVDAYLSDRTLIDIASNAKVTVIQAMGAQNMSNRFYAVHSRRNDRFIRASSQLKAIYSEVDFTEFSFTRHLLTALAEVDAKRFELVANELKEAWTARMGALLEQLDSKVILLWLANHAPEEGSTTSEPLFIDRTIMDRLSGKVSKVVEVVSTTQEREEGFAEMVFGPMEGPAAEEMQGPVVHQRTAAALAEAIKSLI